MNESSVERTIGDFCKANGITFQKQNGMGDRGKADRLCMKQGVAAFLEIKRPGETPTKLQLDYLQKRMDDGFHAAWCNTPASGIEWLKEVFKL